MQNMIKELVILAETLDNKDMIKEACAIDAVAVSIKNIKTAQYIGIQGYWIRNDRCWKNCYRIKRASKPNLSAQEVWTECQGEYVDSINNDDDDNWNKYAEQKETMVKAASALIKQEKETFHKEVNEKLSDGVPVEIAVFSSIETNKNKYADSYIKNGTQLLKLSEKLLETGHQDEAKNYLLLQKNYLKKLSLIENGMIPDK